MAYRPHQPMIPAEGAWEPDGSRERGGESGIRTHDEVAPIPVLKSVAIRTSTPPLVCQKIQTMTVVTYVYLMIASGKVLAAS